MPKDYLRDLSAGLVVSLVALPFCLGIALASGTPLISGLIAGMVGGVLVGLMSGSQISVSGPAAALSTVVVSQIQVLGSFESFLLAVVMAGVLQIGLGAIKAGGLSAFFPTSIVRGLVAAIGIILVLKQIPHLFGNDNSPEGGFSFLQPDQENTFSILFRLVQGDVHIGAMAIGLTALVFLIVWSRVDRFKTSWFPFPVIVVAIGIGLSRLFVIFGNTWSLDSTHFVSVPVAKTWSEISTFFVFPNWEMAANVSVYLSAINLALAASLASMLNLEAIDKLDPLQRRSPPNRELIAQGIGNIVCGLIGGLPLSNVIVRSSVNVNSGGRTKLSTVFHGMLLFATVVLIPTWLNKIPLSCLAALLLVTGLRLASFPLFKRMWKEGPYQFIPFITTLLSILLTDILIGILIGLSTSMAFILFSNMSSPVRQFIEKQVNGDVLHIQLPSQVSFLKRASLEEALYKAERGTHILLSAEGTDYIDPDILSLFRDFRDNSAQARGVTFNTKGFAPHFGIENEVQFDQYTTQQLQNSLTPQDVVQFLKVGNERFNSGYRLTRDLGQQVVGTAAGQHPLAVILSCIDSRSPAELIFDLGLGDVFTIRIAGNVVRSKVLGSMEYACAVAGAKLILVLGHTKCGAINSSIDLYEAKQTALEATGCENLDMIVQEIEKSIDFERKKLPVVQLSDTERLKLTQDVTVANVRNSIQFILSGSSKLRSLKESGAIAIVGAIYHVENGRVEFLND